MDLLLGEIHEKLFSDLRVQQDGYTIHYGATTIHSVRSCPNVGRCRIAFYEYKNSIAPGINCRMAFYPESTCEKCADILSDSLPPMETFLQRRRLVDVLTVKDDAEGCLYCYRQARCVTKVDRICAGCIRAHQQEGEALVEKRMIMGEVLGTDCAGIVAGYMPYFLWGSPS